MIFNEDCWNIIKQYLFNKKDINYRLFMKQLKFEKMLISKENEKIKNKWKLVLLIDKIRENEFIYKVQ